MIHERKQCDVCGKISGVELNDKDFINDNITKIKLKNWKGEDISINLNMILQNSNNTEQILNSAITEYSEFNNFLEDDNIHSLSSFTTIMNQQQEINKAIIKKLKASNVHICKHCYKGIITLVQKFGKANRTVKI